MELANTHTHDTNSETWSALYRYMIPRTHEVACNAHKRGLDLLGFSGQVPDYTQLESSFATQTGWSTISVDGEVPTPTFLTMLTRKQFPVGKSLRPLNETYGAYHPDYWHDAYGHLPILTDPKVLELYEWFGMANAQLQKNPEGRKALGTLYWFLLEYGLILENNEIRLLGSGLLASPLGIERFRTGAFKTRRFNLKRIINTPFDTHKYQPILFWIPSIDWVLGKLDKWLHKHRS